ncbi:MAG: hypothetical protein OHK0029_39740 [Armatimonadaceae bacterium]
MPTHPKRRSSSNQVLRYARYLRCSSDDQGHGDYTTIDTQDELTRNFVLQQGGIDAGRYDDPGKTGTNLKRPGWERLLAGAQKGLFDVVVCTYMSRLGRGDAYTVAEYLLKNEGVTVALVEEGYTDDLAGYAQQSMKKFLDGMYPIQVREWTMTKMKSMFEQGYYVGGRIPFGFRTMAAEGTFTEKAPRKLVPHEANAAFVEEAFSIFLETRSQAAVCRYLERVSGKSWTISNVKHLLTATYYIGTAKWNGMVRENAHPSLVDQATFDAVQDILSSGTRRKGHLPDSQEPVSNTYYLRGLLYCSCNNVMTTTWATSKTGAKVPYY